MPEYSYDSDAAASYAKLVIFSYGATPTVKRYARYTSDIVIGSGSYAGTYAALLESDNADEKESSTNISIDLGKQGGGTEDELVTLTLPLRATPVDHLCEPYEWALTTISILECDPTDQDNTLRILWQGEAGNCYKNPDGNRGLGKIEAVGHKSKWKDVPLGLSMSRSCGLEFGDSLCGYDLAGDTETGTVDTLSVGGDPRKIAVSLSGSDLTDERWSNGQVIVDGLSIKIRRSDGAGNFFLSRLPPPTWASASCTAKPGCDRTPAQCNYYGRISSWRGLGVGVPSYNVLFSKPA